MKITEIFLQKKFAVAKSKDYDDQLDMRQRQNHDTLARLLLSNSVYFKLLLFLKRVLTVHVVGRRATSLLLFGDSHCGQAEIIKQLASVDGFTVKEICLNTQSGQSQRDQISSAFREGRAAKRSSVLLLFRNTDFAFYECGANNGQPELLLQLALLKVQPPTDVDLLVCCTSSMPWLIDSELVRAFSSIVEIFHPTKQEIDKVVNCYLNSGSREEKNCLKNKLTGHKLLDIYR